MGDGLLDLAKGAAKGVTGGVASAAGTLGGSDLNPISAVGDAATRAAGEAIEGKAEEFLWNLAQDVVDGTQIIFHMIVDLMFQITAPQVTGEFIYTMGGRIFFISLPLIVMFAAMRIIVASLRAQALTGARDAFVGAGASVLGTVALVPLTSLAVQAVDAVADGLLSATLADGDEFVDSVIEAVVAVGTVVGNMTDGQTIAGPISPWDVPAGGLIVTAVICLLATGLLLVACVIIGLALVARNMLLYIVIVVGPLCLSGLAWEPTRKWASIWMGWMVALVFTKLAIVVVMGLGVLSITATFESGEITADILPGLTTVLSGILMLVLAAFMPVACFAIFGWMGEGGVRELQAAASGAGGMMASVPSSALSAGQSAGGRLSSMINGAGGGDGGGGSSSPGLVGGGGGGGAEGAAPMAEAAPAAGATVATGGLAAGAMVAGEVASEVGDVAEEAGEAVADATEDTIDGAVSDTTGSGDGYSYEQPAQDESSPGDSGNDSGGPSVGGGPADEPGPTDAPADEPAAPTNLPAPADPPMDRPAPEEPPAPADAPPAPPAPGDDMGGGQ